MSVAERRKYLIEVLSEAYAANVRTNSTAVINQTATVLNIQNIQCGDGIPEASCGDCLRNFITVDGLTGPNYLNNINYINYIRTGVCAGLCACQSNAYQTNTVIFDASGTVESRTDTQNSLIAEQAMEKFTDKYGLEFLPRKEDMIAILKGQNLENTTEVEITTEINQTLAAVTAVEILGTGSIKNVQLTILVDAVFTAIARNSVDIVNKVIQDGVSRIKSVIDAAIDASFADIWNKDKWYFIIIGIVFVISLIVLAISTIKLKSA